MDEGISTGANFNAPGCLNNQRLFNKRMEKSKLSVRGVHRKKTAAGLGQIQKKLNKAKNQGKISSAVVVSSGLDDEAQHGRPQHDWQDVVLSSSATESPAEECKKKLIASSIAKKKSGNNKNCFVSFAEYEDSLKSTPFVFKTRLSRLDWRKLHTIDVDKIIREASGVFAPCSGVVVCSEISASGGRNNSSTAPGEA
ncbi:hypothetical protein R1flu_025331 [Riccia fluitans]|uniref:Uncharacterized protein n=1 Tax=Riccia fluitans TaxID=41844 RepID=A0ABD1XXG0_9MARC